eukprot:9339338-Lingulodinium_polyedra.AAC.1
MLGDRVRHHEAAPRVPLEVPDGPLDHRDHPLARLGHVLGHHSGRDGQIGTILSHVVHPGDGPSCSPGLVLVEVPAGVDGLLAGL